MMPSSLSWHRVTFTFDLLTSGGFTGGGIRPHPPLPGRVCHASYVWIPHMTYDKHVQANGDAAGMLRTDAYAYAICALIQTWSMLTITTWVSRYSLNLNCEAEVAFCFCWCHCQRNCNFHSSSFHGNWCLECLQPSPLTSSPVADSRGGAGV